MYSKQGLSTLFVVKDEVKLYEPFIVILVGWLDIYTIRYVLELTVVLGRVVETIVLLFNLSFLTPRVMALFYLLKQSFCRFSWKFWYNCDICDNRRVSCNSTIGWWFTLHTRVSWWFPIPFVSWSSLWIQPRWVSPTFDVICWELCNLWPVQLNVVGGPEIRLFYLYNPLCSWVGMCGVDAWCYMLPIW